MQALRMINPRQNVLMFTNVQILFEEILQPEPVEPLPNVTDVVNIYIAL